MQDLEGAALVTGAGKRIGRALALRLAGMGFDVAVHCHRSRDEAEATATEIEALGRKACVLAADLACETEAGRLVPEAAARLGRLAVLVNSAAVFENDRLESCTRVSWDRHMEVDLRAPVVLCHHFVAQLGEQGGGAIVNLLDARLGNLTPNFLSYSIAKAGLWAATQVLARQLAPRVRVNAIGPGPVIPEPGRSEERFAALVDALPLRRGPAVEEIAEALAFIVKSPSMTGQLLILDGGQQMGWLAGPGAGAGGA
ncbi:SDR family oxidoreductase [Marinimicrococcus flavescens]|uniref:SDR family oxidoreductase n=1 Tax=Marinimicrococcus flavescens TaxID=3031815 RepID=A0AAP3V138_9PROT|nr:SDR family oxidoreductase [Marinimicrococcus flavescens]